VNAEGPRFAAGLEDPVAAQGADCALDLGTIPSHVYGDVHPGGSVPMLAPVLSDEADDLSRWLVTDQSGLIDDQLPTLASAFGDS